MWIHINERQPLSPGTYRVMRYGPRKMLIDDEMTYDGTGWRTYMGFRTQAVVKWWEAKA